VPFPHPWPASPSRRPRWRERRPWCIWPTEVIRRGQAHPDPPRPDPSCRCPLRPVPVPRRDGTAVPGGGGTCAGPEQRRRAFLPRRRHRSHTVGRRPLRERGDVTRGLRRPRGHAAVASAGGGARDRRRTRPVDPRPGCAIHGRGVPVHARHAVAPGRGGERHTGRIDAVQQRLRRRGRFPRGAGLAGRPGRRPRGGSSRADTAPDLAEGPARAVRSPPRSGPGRGSHDLHLGGRRRGRRDIHRRTRPVAGPRRTDRRAVPGVAAAPGPRRELRRAARAVPRGRGRQSDQPGLRGGRRLGVLRHRRCGRRAVVRPRREPS
jgi:hypothetical protein